MSTTAHETEWFLYVIRCADDSLYTGVSTDVNRRLSEHRSGKGAKYLRGKGPMEMVRSHCIGTRSKALKVEREFRKLSKVNKERLLENETEWIIYLSDRLV